MAPLQCLVSFVVLVVFLKMTDHVDELAQYRTSQHKMVFLNDYENQSIIFEHENRSTPTKFDVKLIGPIQAQFSTINHHKYSHENVFDNKKPFQS